MRVDHDAPLRAQAQRLGALRQASKLPSGRRGTPAHRGESIAIDGAAAVLDVVTRPLEAFEWVVLR
jgi:hypothetical protein